MIRSPKFIIPVVLFTFFVLSGSFADVLGNIITNTEPPIAPVETATATASESATAPAESPSPLPKESPTVNDAPTADPGSSIAPEVAETPTVDADAKFSLSVPASIAVDPRAKSYLLPHLRLSGSTPVLVCIKGHGSTFDFGAQSNSSADSLLITGESSSLLALAGTFSDVHSYLSSAQIWVRSAKALPSSYFSVSATGLTAPYMDVSFCDAHQVQRSTYFRPLEIGLDMSKGKGRLK